MFGHSWRVGRIKGIEIRIDSSWAIIALLITYSFYLQFTVAYRGFGGAPAVLLAIGAAILFFGSVLTHEMAHALVSRRRGIPVRDITLFIFGGATRANVESRGPRDEFVISVVGPLTSLVIGTALIGLGIVLAPATPAPVAGALRYLGFINLFLGAFNLIPGLPLDGGRVLRSALWKGTGNLDRATRVASGAGEVIGYGIMVLGVLILLAGGFVSGLWLAAIGWFLAGAARSSYLQTRIHHLLQGVRAEDVMTRHVVSIPAGISVRDAVDDYFLHYDQSAFPVEEDGRTVGLLTLAAVKDVPRDDWPVRTARQLAEPVAGHATVPPEAPAERVIERLEEGETPVFVREDWRIVGEITPSQIGRYVSRRQAVAA